MNKHQKAVFRPGDHRVGADDIEELLELSHSDDPSERLIAAENLCPCHVRTRIEVVWDALYRMMEDADAKVRLAAWHTLEDGGYPKDDPRMEAILERSLEQETNKGVRRFVELFARPKRERAEFLLKVQDRTFGTSDYDARGKCDFCGESDIQVKKDYNNPLSFNGEARPALVCEACDR